MRIRNIVAGTLGALVAVGGLVVPATAASAASTPAPFSFKSCTAAGPNIVDPAAANKPQPVDENVSIYVGGDFTRQEGSELEGQLVVDGNATIAGTGGYNIGWVGAGSGILPVADSALVRVGGDFTIDGTNRAIVSSKAADGALLPGDILTGGTLSTEAKIDAPGGTTISQSLGRDAALDGFAAWPADDYAILKDLAARNLTDPTGIAGDTAAAWGTLTLTGDAAADRHVFTIPAAVFSTTAWTLAFEDVDPTDIVIITVTGQDAIVNINGLLGPAADTTSLAFGELSSRMLWVFPDATDITLRGAQIPGSVIVPTSGSTTRLEAAGANGRYWVAGDLIQNRGGSEFHSYPFLGDADMTCGTPPVADDTPGATPVAPVDPAVVQAICTDGTATAPTVTAATTTGIAYTVTGTVAAGETVTITATPAEGYTLAAADGWTANNDGTATYTVILADPDCTAAPTPVAPVNPLVTDAVCGGAGPTVFPAVTEGVSYTVDGEIAEGSTVTVTATPQSGYVLTGADGWILHDNGTATRTITLADIDCATPVDPAPGDPKPIDPGTPGAAGGNDDALATTGADSTALGMLGLALLVAGGAAYGLRRRAAHQG